MIRWHVIDSRTTHSDTCLWWNTSQHKMTLHLCVSEARVPTHGIHVRSSEVLWKVAIQLVHREFVFLFADCWHTQHTFIQTTNHNFHGNELGRNPINTYGSNLWLFVWPFACLPDARTIRLCVRLRQPTPETIYFRFFCFRLHSNLFSAHWIGWVRSFVRSRLL